MFQKFFFTLLLGSSVAFAATTESTQQITKHNKYIPNQAEELVLGLSESSRDSTIKTLPILQYEASFDRSNPEALANPKSQFFSSIGYTLVSLRFLIKNSKWDELAQVVGKGLKNKAFSLQDLENLAAEIPDSLFAHAIEGTKSTLALSEKTGLETKELIPIALLAESTLNRKEKKFWDAKQFGKELQYDPESNSFFIHLNQRLGVGKKKVVTKTVRYDREHPEILARGITTWDMEEEMEAMRVLKGEPGLLQARALMTHKDPKTHKRTMTLVTPIFHSGTLEDICDNSSIKLQLKERIKIAHDIMTGIAAMQAKGYVHRDLSIHNYFVNLTWSKKRITGAEAVVGDMGRTIPASTAAGKAVQGSPSYLSPEGYFRSKMKGNDYYQSDLFAVGCVFWQLQSGKAPSWRKVISYKNEKLSLENRYKQHLALIEKERNRAKKKLPISSEYTPNDRFLALVLQMTDPNPNKRGTAQDILAKLEALMKQVLKICKSKVVMSSSSKVKTQLATYITLEHNRTQQVGI